MPCTLRRLEVWQVTPQHCPRCHKLPLPKSAKVSRHQACTILAVSSLLSHKSCSRKQVRLTRRSSHPTSAAGKGRSKVFRVEVPRIQGFPNKESLKPKLKKVKMSEYDSDSDSSVIILTDDDEDDKPIRQRLVEYREGIVKSINQKVEDDETQSKQDEFSSLKTEDDKLARHEPRGDGLANPDINKLSDMKHEEPRRNEDTTMPKEEGDDAERTKLSCLDTWSREEGGRKKEDDDESNSDEDEQFEKHFKQDINFVMAKFLVKKKKVGFGCDVNDNNNNISPFEKKMRRILDQADILIIKKSLDDGGEIFKPRDLDLKKLLPKPAPPPSLPILVPLPNSAPDGLSDDDSPNTTQNIPVADENVAQMPVVFESTNDEKKVHPKEKVKEVKDFKFKPYRPPASRPKKLPPLVPKVLKPAVVFPSIKTKSFKIPRAAKTKQPKWVANGSLWQWALTVDDSGEYSRTEKVRKKVPWASLVVKRPCEEFQLWLVRGTFSEGDDCQWAEEEVVEKLKKDEVKRRREEMMWREKILDKMLGLGSQVEKLVSTRDPLGLDERVDEKDSGTGSLTSGTVAGSDATEEIVENELNVSQQSLVTHIRTPTHTFCMEEDESEGTDCMDENNEDIHMNQKPTKSLISADIEFSLASLPGLRGPPPPIHNNTPAHPVQPQVQPSSAVLQPYPSPPPSLAPSLGFAYTKFPPGQSDTTSNVSQAGSTAAPAEASFSQGTSAKSMSTLSGLISAKKTRLRLF